MIGTLGGATLGRGERSDPYGSASLRDLFEGARVGLVITTLDGEVLEANPMFHTMLGYPDGVLVGRTMWEIIGPEDSETVRPTITALVDGEDDSFVVEHAYRTVDGRYPWGRFHVSVIRRPDGTPEHLALIMEDVDDRRRAEAALADSQALTRLAGSIAGVGGWVVDVADGRISWSPEIHDILEWPGDTAPSSDAIYDLFDPEDRDVLRAAVDRCVRQGTPFDLELRLHTHTGRPLWVRSVAETRRDADGHIVQVLGACQDITASKEAAFESAALAARLSATLESITDAFYTVDADWRFTYVNAQAERLLRRSRSELLGKTIWAAFPAAVGSEMHTQYHRAVDECVTVSLDALFYPPLDAWFEIRAYPSEQGLAVYFRDISDRIAHDRQLERLAADEQAAADRLRELDRVKDAFLSAVSHELRTPLTVVQGMAETLQRLRGQLGDDQRVAIEDALAEQSQRLAELLGDLLDLDRLSRGALAVQRTDTDVLAQIAGVLTKDDHGDRIRLDAPDRLLATVDPLQVQRIVANLLDNARKYAPEGSVTLEVSPLGDDGVRIEVIDEGPGIRPDEAERIFEPLYRVDDEHPRPGTGIGLALVASFAQLHGGRAVAVPSDGGAHIVVELPGPPPGADDPTSGPDAGAAAVSVDDATPDPVTGSAPASGSGSTSDSGSTSGSGSTASSGSSST